MNATDRLPRRVLALALVAAIVVAYSSTWRAGFIWDDDLHVTANPVIVGPLGLKEIWTTPAANYFPLTMTTFWVLHALFGLNPLPYHLVNVLLHAASALLLWAVLRRLRIPGAWLGAALWALHPVQVETAAWISELKNTQSAVFFLLAIWFHVARVEAREAGRPAGGEYALALGCALLAVLSKSSTVMLPVILLLCSWWLTRRWRWRDVVALVPFLALALIVSAWTIWEQKVSSGAAGADWSHSLAQRLVIAGRVPWFYLQKLAWPHPLIFIYPRWVVNASELLAWLPALAAAACAAGLWRRAARSELARATWFACAAFVVLLFPVLGLFDVYFFRFSFVGDHLQYLASMAPLALAGAALARLPSRAGTFLSLALVAGAALATWRQARIYRDDLGLFTATAAANPGAWMAHNNLAEALNDAGRVEEAIAAARQAIALRPDYGEAENNLGLALTRAGRPQQGIVHLQRALQIDPRDAEAANSLGIALIALDRPQEGIASFERALQLRPRFARARYNLGLAHAKLGQPAEALRNFEEALAVQPGYADAEMGIGLALTVLGRGNEGIPHLERATQLSPRSAEIQAGFGRALAAAGRMAEAEVKLKNALRLDPRSVDAHATLALVLRRLGRNDEAAREELEAQRLGGK